MPSVMLFLILIIVAVSGLIAYIGDLVGRKMGRKRLSLLGLRPRHTAIVISVCVGMLIAALTLTTTFATSKRIRDAFFTPLDKLRAEREATREKLEQTQEEAAKVHAQWADVTRKLGEAETRFETSRKGLDAAQAQLADVTGRLGHSQQQLAQVRQNLVVDQARLARLASEQVRLEKRLRTLGQVYSDISLTPPVFTSGQEILTGLIPTTGSEASRRALLTKFVRAADHVVRSAAELPDDAPAIAFGEQSDQGIDRIPTEKAIQILSDRIAQERSTGDVILKFTAGNNVPVKRGFALVIISMVGVYPNSPVYAKNDEVARLEVTIESDTTPAQVFGRLVDGLLRAQVPSALRKRQVVMATRRFNVNHPDSVPETSLSLVQWADLLAASEKACSHQGKVAIIARTRSAVTRYGPLDLSFDVVPAP